MHGVVKNSTALHSIAVRLKRISKKREEACIEHVMSTDTHTHIHLHVQTVIEVYLSCLTSDFCRRNSNEAMKIMIKVHLHTSQMKDL